MRVIQYDKNGFPSLWVDEEDGSVWKKVSKNESKRVQKIRKKEFEKGVDKSLKT